MFSNSQNNIFTDDLEFALGASSSEFSMPNHQAMLPNMLDDFEKQSMEEKLQADKRNALATLNTQHFHDDLFDSFGIEDLLLDQGFSPSLEESNDDDFESREELIKDVDKFLSSLEPQTACPLESEDIDSRDKQLAEDFIDELFRSTLEAEKLNDESIEPAFSGFQPDHGVEFSNVKSEADEEFIEVIKNEGSEDQSSSFLIHDPSYYDHEEHFQVEEREFDDVTIIVIQDTYEEAATIDMDIGTDGDSVLIDEDSDPTWSPKSPEVKKRPYFRRSLEAKHKLKGVDKKERKKRQNVEAARRYRDKKKNEQHLVDGELNELVELNTSLKQQVTEKTNELKTLLKIMTDLGMIKPKK